MQQRAVLIAAGVVVAAVFALARFGMIDADHAGTTIGTAPVGLAAHDEATTSAAVVAPEIDDAAAVRNWLHQQVVQHVSLTQERISELLLDLDEDPGDKSRLLLLPTRRSVPKAARGSADGWSEGHVWPVARGLGPGPTGGGADLHNLRAAEPSYNPAGLDYDDADRGIQPAEALKGDIARSLFYMDVRYDGQDGRPELHLIDGYAEPGRTALGRLCTLLRWNESDPVDLFERRRNEWIAKRQGTSNPFVERPEFARVLWGKDCQ